MAALRSRNTILWHEETLSFLFDSKTVNFRFDMNIFSSTRMREYEILSHRKVSRRAPSSKSRKEGSSVPSSDGTVQAALRPKDPNRSRYPYEKLDFDTSEIRVLKLTGRDHSFHSSITIQHISLIDPPSYYALSYVRTSQSLELLLPISIALLRLYSICSRCFSIRFIYPICS